ncbi:hypothetical protein V5O48_016788 [Marasmius crinis-equi]|uniref:Uncharacterized protein n=1 Tax=Marasmius crinis-equi TaxID=585013 RepID=A0ABR3EQQ9_9AGAR
MLTAYRIPFPLHEIHEVLATLGHVKVLKLYHIQRDYSAGSGEKKLTTGYNSALEEVSILDVPYADVEKDPGLQLLASVLSERNVKRVFVSCATLLGVMEGFRRAGKAFNEGLEWLEIVNSESAHAQSTTRRYDKREACDLIALSLKACAPGLKRFRFWPTRTLELPQPKPCLHFPSLVDYAGSQDFLCGIRLSHTVKSIWVPIAVAGPSQAWEPSSTFTCDLRELNPRTIGILRLAASDVNIERLLGLFPNLRELSAEPSSPVSKERLLNLGPRLREMKQLEGLSILRAAGRQRLSVAEQRAILSVWKAECPSLTYVRLTKDTKYVWKGEGRGWEAVVYREEQGFIPLEGEPEGLSAEARAKYFF